MASSQGYWKLHPQLLLLFLQWKWSIGKYPDLYAQNTLPKYPVKMRYWYQQGLSLLFPGPCTLTWQLYLPGVQLALIRSDPRNNKKKYCLKGFGYRVDENPHKGRRSDLNCSYLHQKLLHNILWKDT